MNEKGHQAEEGGSGLNLRLVILGAVLLLFVVAAVWEFVFVRSAYEKSLATIDEIYNDANEPEETKPTGGSSVAATGPKTKLERIFMTALVDDFDGTVSVDKLDGKSSILKNLKWFDPDESGSITLEEFNAGVKMFEEANGKMSEDDIYDMVGGKSPGEGAPNGAGGQESSSN